MPQSVKIRIRLYRDHLTTQTDSVT